MILQKEHDSKVAGHMGQEKMIELVRIHCFWPQMDQWMENYVHSCPACLPNQAARPARYALLQPLVLVHSAWDEISMDLIVDLPISNECFSI
jgi:hypothetical protein